MNDRTIEETTKIIRADLERALSSSSKRPLILGIAGAQGSGKSTVARALANQLAREGRPAAQISLDDFYLSRIERRRLAARVHPLFVTRGPPGTHDLDAALSFFAAVKRGEEAVAPSFDKARDEPAAKEYWRRIAAGLEIVIFEGWCLGARAEDDAALAQPVNMLERTFDPDGLWRRAVNDALGGAYQTLFAVIDHLVYMRAPSFDVVRLWRTEQELALASTLPAHSRSGLMTAEEVSFFVQYFERITRRMMADLPTRAILTLQLDESRRVTDVINRGLAR